MSKLLRKTTSGSRSDARKVVGVAEALKPRNNPLAFECEGGGRGGRHIETTEKNHLWLKLGCEGGGGGVRVVKTALQFAFGCKGSGSKGRRIETTKKNHLRLAFESEGGGCGSILCVTGISSKLRKKEWEKMGNNICHCPFL